ncbi:MAG TPA: isoprenylcysteine carboxylmethyltransferase family protein [Xanthobacteraceae bacterium]|nr:isoprenylcysteine carboxylmethyltransferase family protein [Xanthobacteraceae bacterium]
MSWVVLLLVWAPGYFTSKRTARVPNLALQIPTSALLVVCFVLLFNPRLWGLGRSVTPHTAAFGLTGLALDLAGVAFAICARVMLGRNWSGMVMTVKEDHQLVQSGPYAIVRHPIYTGLASAILGTALTVGTLASYIGVAAGLTALLVRIHVEEKLMADQFGEAHAAYRRRTKKLIPFIW